MLNNPRHVRGFLSLEISAAIARCLEWIIAVCAVVAQFCTIYGSAAHAAEINRALPADHALEKSNTLHSINYGLPFMLTHSWPLLTCCELDGCGTLRVGHALPSVIRAVVQIERRLVVVAALFAIALVQFFCGLSALRAVVHIRGFLVSVDGLAHTRHEASNTGGPNIAVLIDPVNSVNIDARNGKQLSTPR